MSAWAEEQLAVLRKNARRISASQIGLIIGKSKNAVIGTAHRQSIQLRTTSQAARRRGKPPCPRPVSVKPPQLERLPLRDFLAAVRAMIPACSSTRSEA